MKPAFFLVCLALAACVGAPPESPMQSEQWGEVRFTPLAPGVWMHSADQNVPLYDPVVSNGLIVVEGASARLIDTGWNDAQTASILAFAAERLKAPITEAVFTHAHADKMGGVGLLRARGIATFALPLSNQRAPDEGVSSAKRTIAMSDDATPVRFGSVELAWPGAGHTPDNIVVWLPKAAILFGGCLIRPGESDTLGNTGDADIAHWDDAVMAVKRRFSAARMVVPSHGAPGGPELLDHSIALAQKAQH